jgi:hypothetical protein
MGKGNKGRLTMLPVSLQDELLVQVDKAKVLHKHNEGDATLLRRL